MWLPVFSPVLCSLFLLSFLPVLSSPLPFPPLALLFPVSVTFPCIFCLGPFFSPFPFSFCAFPSPFLSSPFLPKSGGMSMAMLQVLDRAVLK